MGEITQLLKLGGGSNAVLDELYSSSVKVVAGHPKPPRVSYKDQCLGICAARTPRHFPSGMPTVDPVALSPVSDPGVQIGGGSWSIQSNNRHPLLRPDARTGATIRGETALAAYIWPSISFRNLVTVAEVASLLPS